MKISNYFRRNLYHGTRLDRIPSIQTEGLDPKYFGGGVVYFSDSFNFAATWGNFEAVVI